MKKHIKSGSLVAVAATAILMSSCAKEFELYDPVKDATAKYEKNWKDTFGNIDPNQDWNMATQVKATINVTIEGNFTIKIYSSNPEDKSQQAYLLAKTSIVGGIPTTLNFDAIKGLNNVYVALVAGNNIGLVKKVSIEDNAINANFFVKSANKAITRSAASGEFEKTTDYVQFTREEALEILNALPENADAIDKNNNYEFESKGEFAIYPVYGCTSAEDRVGYYYYNPKTETIEDRHEVTLTDNFKNEDLQIIWNHGGTNNINGGQSYFTEPVSNNAFSWGMKGMQSKGYLINIPSGYRVGFWIENTSSYSGQKFYSNRILNPELEYYSAVGKHSNGNYFFGLEDWLIKDSKNGGYNSDCNDVVFFVKNVGDNDLPEPVPPTPVVPDDPKDVVNSWIIACEDLGSTDDYDFNDIVFKVSHVAGQNIATVTPLAAGGVYESHILFNNVALGETHQMLGAKATEGNYPMINTSSITATGTSQTVTVPTDFSLANSMGGFGITVKTNDNINAVIITAPDAGEAPQMFCVPGTWAWPTERTKIQEAYPNFADWNGNSSNADWYKTPTAGKVLGGN